MGDRCYVTITFAEADEDRFADVLDDDNWYSDVDEHDDGSITVGIEEANGGMCDSRETLASAGLAYFGSHGSGHEYGPYVFAAVDGEFADVPTDRGEQYPVVPVLDNGQPCPEALAEAQRYLDICERARARIQRNGDEAPC